MMIAETDFKTLATIINADGQGVIFDLKDKGA